MLFSSITYDEPVFRPPAEAFSSIIQVTLGCSWNRCAFCDMYTSKNFRARKFEDLQADIKALSKYEGNIKKVFLADGNAFVLSTSRLLEIVNEIRKHYQHIQRISAYALPRDILDKSDSELEELRNAGLKLLYIGIESGDDELLKRVNKSETYSTTVEGIKKAHKAGINTSVMIITGLGGKNYSQQHAIHSAELINQINPKFLSTLTLNLPLGIARYQEMFGGEYIQQTAIEQALELKLFLEHLHLENSIFRSDHVSNNIVLKGVLSKDKRKLLDTIDSSLPLQ